VDFEQSEHVNVLTERVRRFMQQEVYPAEKLYYEQEHAAANRWTWQPVLRELRTKAKTQGLWIFPLPKEVGGHGLSLLEYAPLAEAMSTSPISRCTNVVVEPRAPESSTGTFLYRRFTKS